MQCANDAAFFGVPNYEVYLMINTKRGKDGGEGCNKKNKHVFVLNADHSEMCNSTFRITE